MDHRVSKDMISSGMSYSGSQSKEDLGRTQYGAAARPDALMNAYQAMYPQQPEQLDEGYKEIDRKKENKMYARAGNLARTALSSKGKKKEEAQKKSSNIVSAITKQKENKRFDEIGKSPKHNEEADLFDIIKGRLIDEGYSEEEAIRIMVNMSEEWKQSIIEMSLTPDQEQRRRDLSKAINKSGTPGYPGVNSPETRKMQGEYIQLQKLKGV